MDDVYGRIEVFPQYFMPSKEAMESPDGLSTSKNNLDTSPSSRGRSCTPKRAKGAASLLRLLSIPHFRWSTSNEDDDKIELSRAEVESLRTEIADAEERESHLKARYEIQRKNVVVCSLLKSGHILFFRKKKVEIC